MKEEGSSNTPNQELEKYRLASQWSVHFLNEISRKIESSLLMEEGSD